MYSINKINAPIYNLVFLLCKCIRDIVIQVDN